MENLYYNLSKEEFTKGKKLLLWGFSSLFFLAGLGIIFMNVILHDMSINISLCAVPFGISLVTGLIAGMATFRGKDHYFNIDIDKIEFRYGVLHPVRQIYLWNDVIEIHFAHKQKKVKLVFNNNSSVIINLTWIEKKKSSHIRKHLYYVAREKNINTVKLQVLASK
jgi:hypothetical protein